MDLTARQKKILEAIVEAYAEVASPVGSVTLAKIFNVSSATVRNEMSALEQMGFIEQPHTSAGRIPTDKGYRFYVNGLQDSKNQLEAIDRSARAIDTRVNGAGEIDQAIRSAVRSLVEITHNVGLATIGGSLYVRGFADLFAQPEYLRPGMVQQVAALLDDLEPWLRETAPNHPLNVFIGQENPVGKAAGSSLIISRYRSPYSDTSYIGVLGPTRQDYKNVMSLVSHAGRTLEKAMEV
jgi:heat-inducible transcriptional repressor